MDEGEVRRVWTAPAKKRWLVSCGMMLRNALGGHHDETDNEYELAV